MNDSDRKNILDKLSDIYINNNSDGDILHEYIIENNIIIYSNLSIENILNKYDIKVILEVK